MSRKRTEIVPIRAERVKILINREGITQNDFAVRIGQTQQNISRILNLKTALTEETARIIVEKFPEYRIEWLLGYDDSMTNRDVLSSAINQMNEESSLMDTGFFSYLKLYDFEVSNAAFEKTGDLIADKIREVHSGVTITRDGKSVTLPLVELRQFQNEIGEYIELRLKHMMK